jgi:hypothetical protein
LLDCCICLIVAFAWLLHLLDCCSCSIVASGWLLHLVNLCIWLTTLSTWLLHIVNAIHCCIYSSWQLICVNWCISLIF